MLKKINIIYGIFLSLLLVYMPFIMPQQQCNNIIFDLDGVLIALNKMRVAWLIGPLNLVGGINTSLKSIERSVFEFLESIEPYKPNDTLLISSSGNRLPALMVSYLEGFLSSQDIKDKVALKCHLLNKCYKKKFTVLFIRAVTDFIFSPSKFVRAYQPLAPTVKLLQACYKAKNSDGSRKNRIFILSNLDSTSFSLLASNPLFSNFLGLCDDIVISADVHLVKPDPQIFTYCFKRFTIDPLSQRTFYLDDNKQNLAAAQSVGIANFYPIHVTTHNSAHLSAYFKKLKVI